VYISIIISSATPKIHGETAVNLVINDLGIIQTWCVYTGRYKSSWTESH